MLLETRSSHSELVDPVPPRRGAPAGVAVVIPAWQPGQQLLALVSELRQAGVEHMVLVDDGSGPACAPIFSALESLDGVAVVRHPVNQGKGRALKSAFAFVLHALPQVRGLVTADADGQHLPEDILAVARCFVVRADRAVLGVRRFDGTVPLRSRVGNRLTRRVFTWLTGHAVSDTQTGLRALPRAALAPLLVLPGDRYEYETVMLAHLFSQPELPAEQPIQTVYLEGNRSSHFNPLWDSLRIYRALLAVGLRRMRPATSKASGAGVSTGGDESQWHGGSSSCQPQC